MYAASPNLDQSQFKPGDPFEKVAGRKDRLRAFAKARGLASSTTRFAELGWRTLHFGGFADYMQTSEFDAGLQAIDDIGPAETEHAHVAEAVPCVVNRSLIADALTVRGVTSKTF